MAEKDKAKGTAQISQELGLENLDTSHAIDMIAQDILLSLYGQDKELDAKIRKTYEDWNGAEWFEDNDKVLSTLLLGPPGQGKTTSFKQAAKKVSKALGLKYIENPGDDIKVTKNDFLFVSQEFSAENSKVDLGGIPAKVEEDGIEFMTKLVNKRLAMMNRAGGSLLLLDDFPNASPNIQNVGLSLTDEKRFQGLNLLHSYVGLTGNLGAVDGTHTTRLSTALRGRCKIFYTEDKLENYAYRTQVARRDELGDAGVLGFLQRFEQYFAQMPNIRQSGGFPSPRTWDHFMIEARRTLARSGGKGKDVQKALPKLQKLASSLLGLEVGQAVYGYMYSLLSSADPLARQVIQDGKLDKKELEKRFDQGFSASSQHFAYQYALALSDYAVKKIVKDGGKMEESIKRFAMGVQPLTDDAFNFAVDDLKQKMANQVDSLSTAKTENSRVLTLAAKEQIVRVINEVPEFSDRQRSILIDALTDRNKFTTTRTRARKS